ncbi:DUF4835 family protein [Aureitalea marina]|uniref:DUF4835 domain-containing protein n=1 Tax=Aureitalea marina TaxID=930804 RepID=A0A2S7KN37_9FLAO|nr:DUF4835 family protein [Aureitalea marina]PQB04022.1 DUF4835 domain-containing protein [Aureitalea marina]
MRSIIAIILIFSFTVSYSQELNATVNIDAVQTGQPNLQVFRTLEQQLTEYLNNTRWTNQAVKNQERIDCNFSIIVSAFDGTLFSASLQVQASRPVYNSTYDSPIYNYNDAQFNFDYIEFQPLVFNLNRFDSNLMSVIAYHVYTILALDAATFERGAGIPFFQTAKQIINTAAGSNFSGWKATDGQQSRFRYNDAILSNLFAPYQDVLYDYHRLGMDVMADNPREGKEAVIASMQGLKGINSRRPNSFVLRTFFDAKSQEISSMFSGGPQVDIANFVEDLNRMAPTKRNDWSQIKF